MGTSLAEEETNEQSEEIADAVKILGKRPDMAI